MMIRKVAAFFAALILMWSSAGGYESGHWRGPEQDGVFASDGLPETWSPDGENLFWHAPYGSRSSPLVMNGRVYLINRAGEGSELQERVMALSLETGKLAWEHRFNVFLTDIVAHRVGWANLAGDPETGNIYAHGVQGRFFCFAPDGKILWSRSLTEELGRISGYGGRTNTPTVEGDLVLISFLNSSWGPQGKGLHRYLAMDKLTGEVVYWAAPSGKPLDTTYAVPVVVSLDGRRVLLGGLADGTLFAMNPRTGERLWQSELSKRGINSSVVYGEGLVYGTHSEENVDSTLMGAVVCLDARTGKEVWKESGLPAGYASPILHEDLLLVPDNSANFHCFDAKTGDHLWDFNYGTEAKGSPVYADGKVYVGEVRGAYHILRVSRAGCERLDEDRFSEPSGAPIEIFGTPAIAGNRVLLPTRTDLYCIGIKGASTGDGTSTPVAQKKAGDRVVTGESDHLRLQPAEFWLAPGASQSLSLVNLGVGGNPSATFEVKGLQGTVDADGRFTAATANRMQAGVITATAGELSASARVRIVPPLPYKENFESLKVGLPPAGYITSKLKCQVTDYEGGKVLRKLADRPAPPFARLRCYMTPPLPANYTVQADLLGVSKKGRFLPDMGLINSRYLLILTGTSERVRKLRLVTWAPIPRIQLDVEFPWEPDRWYTSKLSVDVDNGVGIVRGKVWPRGEKEPESWNATMKDSCPNLEGSPGLYAYSVAITGKSKGTEVLFDNVEVFENE